MEFGKLGPLDLAGTQRLMTIDSRFGNRENLGRKAFEPLPRGKIARVWE